MCYNEVASNFSKACGWTRPQTHKFERTSKSMPVAFKMLCEGREVMCTREAHARIYVHHAELKPCGFRNRKLQIIAKTINTDIGGSAALPSP